MRLKLSFLAAFIVLVNAVTVSAQNARVNPVPANRLYPKIKIPATSLVVVDLGADKIDGQVAACGLQGIINRDSRKKVYVTNTFCKDNHGNWNNTTGNNPQAQMGDIWLHELFSKIPKEVLARDTTQQNPGFLALLARYPKAAKGIIIYDHSLEDATIEAATTIAGQTDGLILSPELAEQVKSYNFPVIADLRGKFTNDLDCLNWLIANYFAGANKQVAFTWSHMSTGLQSWGAANKDYVVANRLFTYYLNIENEGERNHYADIVKLYPAGTPIMGWTNELSADHLFATLGYFMVPCIAVENLSVMSSFPSVKGNQPPPKVYPIKANAVYVACLISDGDNLEHSLVYEPYTMINSKNYGAIPITWVINPGITDLAPKAFEWMLARTGNQEFAAMMSDGSPNTDRFTGFSFYCDFAKHYVTQAGIKTMKQMLDADPVSWRVQAYAINSGYAGTDARGVGPYEYHFNGQTFNIGTTNMKDEWLFKAIDNAPAGKPLFLSVFFAGANRDVPTEAKLLAEKLKTRGDGKKYYFVRTMDLAATYRAYSMLHK
jgi:hypothetical protein